MSDEKTQEGIKLDVNPETTPILYTDSIFITINEDGAVLDVCQKLGNTNQARVVSRVGMSKSHAKKFHKALGDLLDLTEGQLKSGKRVEV